MPLQIVPLTMAQEADWTAFLNSHPDASLFHTVSWKNLISASYKYKALHFLVYKGNAVQGICPVFFVNSFLYGKKLTTAPFNFYGEPLSTTPKVSEFIFAELKRLGKAHGVSYVELKSREPLSEQITKQFRLSSQAFYERTMIPIGSEDEMRGRLKRLAKRMILKAEEGGMTFEQTDKIEDLRAFYNIMVKLYCRKHLTIFQSFTLLENYLTYLKPHGHMQLCVGKLNGKVVGGTLLFFYKDHLFDQWSLSDVDVRELSPNYFIIWNALLVGHARGMKDFDLGYTSPHDAGLNQFKTRWGGVTTKINFYFMKINPKAKLPQLDYYTSFGLVRKVIKISPQWSVKLLSKLFVKHFG
ncbi:MAG: GNAT family N-acetyltransferase [Candidatus Woesearchaeota archaeon]|nr:MAG: GNAT family N-acetyltransferase [Candidatus Woesearchaeota archaeon]